MPSASTGGLAGSMGALLPAVLFMFDFAWSACISSDRKLKEGSRQTNSSRYQGFVLFCFDLI